jgi:F0F1-type ATP synthase assembly protein I
LPKNQPQPEKNKKDSGSSGRSYMKYSGMAFEMAAILFAFVFIGKKIDERVAFEKPWFTILGVLVGAFAAFYITLKDLFTNNK